MPEQSTAAAPNGTPPPAMGLPARFLGIFFSPGRVFESLKARPTWFFIVLLTAVLIAAFQFGFSNTEKGGQIVRDQIVENSRNAGREIPPEQLETMVKVQKFVAPAAIIVVTLLFTVVLAFLVYLIFNIILGGEATFRQVLSFYAHVTPITVLQQGLTMLIIYIKGTASPVTSLAAFLPLLEHDTFLYRVSVGIDVFTIWQVGVLAVGLGMLYRFTTGKCAGFLYSTYLGLVVVISLIIGLFS